MKTSIAISALFMLALVGFYKPVAANEDELKAGSLQPRIGVVSETVARQKLKTYGVTKVQEVKLVGNQYLIKAVYEGKPMDLEMNAESGFLAEKGASVQLPIAPSVKSQIIDSYQLKLDCQELVKPELIQQPPN
jgi:hypothetical protein